MPSEPRIVLARSPIEGASHQAYVAPGTSLAEALGEAHERLHVELNGEYIPRAEWERRCLTDNDLLTVLEVPQGGGGGGNKDIMRVVAMIAVAVVAAWAAPLMVGAMGFVAGTTAASIATTVVGAGLTMVGSMLVNALIPPQVPKISDTGGLGPGRFNRLTSSRNPLVPYGVLPRAYGRFRWYPPLAANTYTETFYDKQHLVALFCLGYGPLMIGTDRVGGASDAVLTLDDSMGSAGLLPYKIRVGETDLHQFSHWDMEIGRPDQISIYTNDVHEEQLNIAFDFIDKGGPDNSGGQGQVISQSRDTLPNIDEFSVDIAFPIGIWSRTDDGKLTHVDKVRFSIAYAPKGSTNWTRQEYWIESERRDDPFAKTFTFSNLTPGQYTVTVTREETYVGVHSTHMSDAVWTSLRSIRYSDPWNLSGVVLAALRIQATDQLSGALDSINFETSSILRTWNGTAFVERETANPAWAYLDCLTGPQLAHPVPTDRIDLAGIAAWAAWCDAENFTYNFVHDGEETVVQRAREVAITGRGSFGIRDGLFTVVRDLKDNPPGTDPAVQMFTPRNSWGFSFNKVFRDIPHALKMRYVDPVTWEQADRIVYMDGYDETSATEFEVMDTQGITDAQQVWREGRYYLAQAVQRPETYTLTVDFENLIATRGDRVRVQHDVLRVGLVTGRIKAVGAGQITLDEEVQMVAGKQYVARVRTRDGRLRLETVSTVPGTTKQLSVFSTTAMNVDDLVVFGEKDVETIEAKIIEIEYHQDLSATLRLVPAADSIHDSDTGAIPPWDPGIRPKPEHVSPLPPYCGGYDYNSGQLAMRFTVPSQQVRVDRVYFKYLADINDKSSTEVSTEATAGTVFLPGIEPGEAVLVYTRSRSSHGVMGEWSDPPCTIAPTMPGISNFRGNGTDYGHLLQWNLPAGNWRGVELLNGDSNNCVNARIVWRGPGESAELAYPHPTTKYYWIRLIAQDGTANPLVPNCTAGVMVKTKDPLTIDDDFLDWLQKNIPPMHVDGVPLYNWLRDLRGRVLEELAIAAGFPSADERDEVFTVVGQDVIETKGDLKAEVHERELLGAVVQDNYAAIIEESKLRAEADRAIIEDTKLISAAVNDNVAAIYETNRLLVDTEQALAQQIKTLGVVVNENTAGIQLERTVRAREDHALAQKIDTVETDLGGVRTSVQVTQASVDGIAGKYAVKIDNNGNVSGFGIISSPLNGVVKARAYFLVDTFAIVAPGRKRAAFKVDAARNMVVMDGAQIADLSVDRLRIKNHALSGTYYDQVSDNTQYSTNWSELGRTPRHNCSAAAGGGNGSVIFMARVKGDARYVYVRIKVKFYTSSMGFLFERIPVEQVCWAVEMERTNAITGSTSKVYRQITPVSVMYGGPIHSQAYYVETIVECRVSNSNATLSQMGIMTTMTYK